MALRGRGVRKEFFYANGNTLDIIDEVILLGAKPADFPIEQNHTLALATSVLLDDPERYRRLVGRLKRPDLAYTIYILAQFMQESRQEHWDVAIRTIRYL